MNRAVSWSSAMLIAPAYDSPDRSPPTSWWRMSSTGPREGTDAPEAYLQKPFAAAALGQLVRRILDQPGPPPAAPPPAPAP